MNENQLSKLRDQVDEINLQILDLLNQRAEIVLEIGNEKKKQGTNRFDPVRERQSLDQILESHKGPFESSTIKHIFKEIFKASLELQEVDYEQTLLVSRKAHPENTIVNVNGETIGDGTQGFIIGPCSVESYEQVKAVAVAMKEHGLTLLRGGAFKPRTSPYDFQGLGLEGLQILRKVADELDMKVVSEIVTPADVEMALDYVDVIQIGARNMQNFELLKTVGGVKKPVLTKTRTFSNNL